MIHETENPQYAKSVCPGKPARTAHADLGRYFTQAPHCWISRGTAHIRFLNYEQCWSSAIRTLSLQASRFAYNCIRVQRPAFGIKVNTVIMYDRVDDIQ